MNNLTPIKNCPRVQGNLNISIVIHPHLKMVITNRMRLIDGGQTQMSDIVLNIA